MTKLTLTCCTIALSMQTNAQIALQALEGTNYNTPVGVEFLSNTKYHLTVKDNNYLPFAKPTTVANWNTNVNPDATMDKPIEYDLPIGLPSIPIRVTQNTTIPAFSTTVQVDGYKFEDGQSRVFDIHWPAQSVTTDTKEIIVRITPQGQNTLPKNLFKKLDLNSGLGNDGQGVEILSFSYPTSQAGGTSTFTWRAVPAIPDKCYGKTTLECVGYGANVREHDFLYLPILGPDNRYWLSNNLGAEYTNTDSTNFNPAAQAGENSNDPEVIKKDPKAFGSLFQWGRKPDGHELIDWKPLINNNNPPLPKYGTKYTKATSYTNPNTNEFIAPRPSWGENSMTYHLWLKESENNPCPVGLHVPYMHRTNGQNISELDTLIYAIGREGFWYDEKTLRLPATGFRKDNRFTDIYNVGFLIASSNDSSSPDGLLFSPAGRIYPAGTVLTINYGMPVRCIMDY